MGGSMRKPDGTFTLEKKKKYDFGYENMNST